jgi:hypothetical protein
MKTMVGEFFDPMKAAIPLSERQFLRDRRQPPDKEITRETNGLASGSIRLSESTQLKVLHDDIPKSRIRRPRRLSLESFTLIYSAAKFPIS